MVNFSIIIPLYNKASHIQRTIKSVLAQSCQDFEIIIIDDGSTDSSFENANKITDSRIKLIQQKNQGVSSARNFGIKHASYDYIGLLDADDMWKPTFLDTIKSLIEEFPNAGAYGTSYEFIKDGGEIIPRKAIPDFPSEKGNIVNFFKESIDTPVLSASSTVIPKYVFNQIGEFPIGISRGEDLDMWIRIALKYDIAVTNKICATYFLDANNRACNNKKEYEKSLMSYVEEMLSSEKNKGNNPPYFEEYMISRIINKARYFIEENQFRKSRKLLLKYKYTKYNKKKWLKSYILSFKPLYILNEKLRR